MATAGPESVHVQTLFLQLGFDIVVENAKTGLNELISAEEYSEIATGKKKFTSESRTG